MSAHAQETDLLAQLFESDVAQGVNTTYNSIQLKETGADAQLKKLTIQHLDESALVLFLEKGQTQDSRYTRMFSKVEGWTHHKACDAVIFLHWRKQDYVVYVELKSNNVRGCDKQFEASEHFVNYAFEVLSWQRKHERLKRCVRRVVFNTKKTICQTLHKLPINPRKAVDRDITFIKVSNNDYISPANFCS